jgi:hypothetical protein
MSQQQTMNRNNNQQLNAPFRAKSAGVSLFAILIIGTYYIANLLSLLSSDNPVTGDSLNLILTTIVLIIIVEIVLQTVLFIGAGRIEARSERDKIAAAYSSSNAYVVLTMGAFVTVAVMFADFTPLKMGNVLVVAFLMAEIVKFASRIVYYRRTTQRTNP